MYWGGDRDKRAEKETERFVLYPCPDKTEFRLFYYLHFLALEDIGKILKACRCIYRHKRSLLEAQCCTCNLHHAFLRAEGTG